MQPLDLISWALAIGLAWAAIVLFMPVDRWVGTFLARRHTRLKDLEGRIIALERKLEERAAATPQMSQSD